MAEELAVEQPEAVEPTALDLALHEIDGLRRALESRTVIGQAIGILMTQERLTAEGGFSYLVERSSRLNVKVRDVAAEIVADVERNVRDMA